MINLIILSKNRPLQLHATLKSIYQNYNIFDEINVIIKVTDDKFEQGYMKLQYDFYEESNLSLFKENKLKNDILLHLRDDFDYTCFIVDDDIVFRKIIIDKSYIIKTLESNDIACFSLRLGNNCRNSPKKTIFDWTKQRKNFAYPLSLDGHIFRTDLIKPMIEKINFNNPNALEAHLQGFKPAIPKYIACFEKSILVGIPINKVSDTSSCSAGEKFSYTPEYLNNKYLDGWILDIDKMDFSGVNDCHCEIEFKFKKA